MNSFFFLNVNATVSIRAIIKEETVRPGNRKEPNYPTSSKKRDRYNREWKIKRGTIWKYSFGPIFVKTSISTKHVTIEDRKISSFCGGYFLH